MKEVYHGSRKQRMVRGSANYAPEGIPTSDHLKIRTVALALDEIPEQHVVLETLFISVEPYLRGRMTGLQEGLYFAQFNLKEVRSVFFLSVHYLLWCS